ncbi:hypothetical protein BDZ91DRAFT_754590 [Kalaharituber pfeilii]|nr:hypothetical protein BDZ91DRAFT_754590 [Kalaharituber pfeilii]
MTSAASPCAKISGTLRGTGDGGGDGTSEWQGDSRRGDETSGQQRDSEWSCGVSERLRESFQQRKAYT